MIGRPNKPVEEWTMEQLRSCYERAAEDQEMVCKELIRRTRESVNRFADDARAEVSTRES